MQISTKVVYISLFESATEKLHGSYRSVPENQDPEVLVTGLVNAYKRHTGRFKRIFYQAILLKKPVVSIAKLSRVTARRSVTGQDHFIVQEEVYDPTLTAAMRDPTVLRNVDRDNFYREYKDVLVEVGGPTPQAAILIHLVNDLNAAKVLGIVGSAISITVSLVGAFAF
ncbi:hypothetical protein F53441_7236 [Fusarium austroafricanum]|uniref:Uncharacterized protein n=1 Tax=Fusarium austroafricanum TaxID=2364996 RepID=A0A8H4KGS2_9HYPO|nr:hypothetical protein F53441_7236 [Fusarium austroafricanum]